MNVPRVATVASFLLPGYEARSVKPPPSIMYCVSSGGCPLLKWSYERDNSQRAGGCGNGEFVYPEQGGGSVKLPSNAAGSILSGRHLLLRQFPNLGIS